MPPLLHVSRHGAEENGLRRQQHLVPASNIRIRPAWRRCARKRRRLPNGKGLLWKIEGHGQAPSFLLGTMHVTDPRVLAMPGGATEAFARAETVIVESDEIVDQNRATRRGS